MKKYFGLLTTAILFLALPLLAQRPGEGNQQQRPGEGNQRQEGNQGQFGQRPGEPNQGERGNQQGRPGVQGDQNHPPRGNGGHIPQPPPQREHNAKPETQRLPDGRSSNLPHVADDRWYGHDRPNDKRYRVDHPFEHGRFDRIGPDYRWSVVREDLDHRYVWFPDGYFQVADWDWPVAQNWCWNCGDDFVVYDDPDHPGWYMLYNIDTGQYVHAMFMGT